MKSATTYLQALCNTNAERLRKQGVWWPGTAANFLATQDILGAGGTRAEHKDAWAALAAAADQHPDTVLISNEMLLNHPDNELKSLVDALDPAEVSIIITARDLARVLPSHWQTFIRSGRTTPWAKYVRSVLRGPGTTDAAGSLFWRQHNLPEAIARCAGLVGAQRVTLVTVPASGADPALTGERFLSAVGVPYEGFEQPAYRNVSLGVHSAELARRLNKQVQDWDRADRREALRKSLYSKVLETRYGQEPRLALTPEQWEAASEHARHLVEALRGMEARLVGDLDDLIPRNKPSSEAVDPAASSPADLLAAAEFGLIGLGARYADLSRRLEVAAARGRGTKSFPRRRGQERSIAGSRARRWIGSIPGVRSLRARVSARRRAS